MNVLTISHDIDRVCFISWLGGNPSYIDDKLKQYVFL